MVVVVVEGDGESFGLGVRPQGCAIQQKKSDEREAAIGEWRGE